VNAKVLGYVAEMADCLTPEAKRAKLSTLTGHSL